MLTPVYTRQFERDLRRIKKRRKNTDKIKIILRSLIEEGELDPIRRNHALILIASSGNRWDQCLQICRGLFTIEIAKYIEGGATFQPKQRG